jgi:uncharacterized protein YukE
MAIISEPGIFRHGPGRLYAAAMMGRNRVSQSNSERPSLKAANAGSPSAAQSILGDLNALRNKIADAWQERGVMLTPDEQKKLRDEIKATCNFLTDLTISS